MFKGEVERLDSLGNRSIVKSGCVPWITAGTPVKEPVFQYGPFVLNSKNEMIDAIYDYETGKMGYLT